MNDKEKLLWIRELIKVFQDTEINRSNPELGITPVPKDYTIVEMRGIIERIRMIIDNEISRTYD